MIGRLWGWFLGLITPEPAIRLPEVVLPPEDSDTDRASGDPVV